MWVSFFKPASNSCATASRKFGRSSGHVMLTNLSMVLNFQWIHELIPTSPGLTSSLPAILRWQEYASTNRNRADPPADEAERIDLWRTCRAPVSLAGMVKPVAEALLRPTALHCVLAIDFGRVPNEPATMRRPCGIGVEALKLAAKIIRSGQTGIALQRGRVWLPYFACELRNE